MIPPKKTDPMLLLDAIYITNFSLPFFFYFYLIVALLLLKCYVTFKMTQRLYSMIYICTVFTSLFLRFYLFAFLRCPDVMKSDVMRFPYVYFMLCYAMGSSDYVMSSLYVMLCDATVSYAEFLGFLWSCIDFLTSHATVLMLCYVTPFLIYMLSWSSSLVLTFLSSLFL